MVDVGNLRRLAELERARSRGFLADDHLEQGGLTHAIRADHTYDAVARQRERQIIDEHALSKRLVQMVCDEHLAAQTRAGGNVNL